jgi:hypothetical protein
MHHRENQRKAHNLILQRTWSTSGAIPNWAAQNGVID